MLKCGWTHCGQPIYDGQEKVKIGKRWYHAECAHEKELINDTITKFIEQVNHTDITVLRKIINDIIYNENKPAEYVMFALDYAIAHPEMKLTFPQGLYRICNDQNVLHTWCKQQADKKVGSHNIELKDIERTTTEIKKRSGKTMVSDLF